MISKDELVKNVAESCGVALEISDFFFEVFVNRLSNRLKPGEILHFNNFGYFQKRNCRIQLEKSSDSPTSKAYLVKLVIFSLETKIKNDLNSVHFLKIPNLKTLWVDDQDFQKSLEAGDFAPYADRNELIKSFATKAEVIISGLRKDYDNELEDELIIPLTFDLNFLIQTGKKSVSSGNRVTDTFTNKESDDTQSETAKERIAESGLPWNYGTKFSEKKEDDKTPEDFKKKESADKLGKDKLDKTIIEEKEKLQTKINKNISELKDFEPVPSHLSNDEENDEDNVGYDTIKFSLGKRSDVVPEGLDTEKKFTEVKAKTEAYNLKQETKKKNKGDKKSNLLETRLKYQSYKESKNYLPYIMLFAFIIIAGAAVYFYFLRGNGSETESGKVVLDIKPPSNVTVVERDNEFAVTYPYSKSEGKIKVSGYSPDAFLVAEVKPEVIPDKKPEIKPEVKPEVKPIVKSKKTNVVKEQPTTEVKPTVPKEERAENKPKITEEKSSRIFLYKSYYVVYVGSFNSSEDADREADKYFGLGYNAYVEVIAARRGKSIYKLNVGDFTSEEFAREFESKYLNK